MIGSHVTTTTEMPTQATLSLLAATDTPNGGGLHPGNVDRGLARALEALGWRGAATATPQQCDDLEELAAVLAALAARARELNGSARPRGRRAR
jgi:hypothetical protein